MSDFEVIYTMQTRGHISAKPSSWLFFKEHFLFPTPKENGNTQALQQHMIDNGHGNQKRLPKKEAKKVFLQWIRKRWIPTIAYPNAMRANPNSHGNRKERQAVEFESKLFAYYCELLGPDKIVEADKSTLSLGNQLGLFAAKGLVIYAGSKDTKSLWFNLHQVNCTDDEWFVYQQSYSSCFALGENEKFRKRYVLTGPLSLANHHCDKGFITFKSCEKIGISGKGKYKKGEEIFMYYGEDYFENKNCVCCNKSK